MPDDDEDWTELISADDLTGETSLDSYVSEQLSEAANSEHIEEIRGRLGVFVRGIEAHADPDDVWWEWVQGTEPQMQKGGLAVVRNGKIVWATMTWIS